MDKEACIKCSKCDEACPYYLEPMKLADDGNFDWAKCENCGLCRDECPTAAIKYDLGIRRRV
jgi:formate hydrogenlyase subunit 6/NADH:ubiquinone oxidoreductase subunit I